MPVNKKIRRILMAVLGLIFIGSVAMVIYRGIQYREGEETYAEAESLVDLPDLTDLPESTLEEGTEEAEAPQEQTVYVDPYADALRNMDFTALREVNDDVLGWILIPGTVISYPLLQGNDNSYYLNHTWKKWTSVVGAIFMEYTNSPDLRDFNTIIYGHRMNNGSMFASLKYYKKQSYWSSHPYVYITDDNGSHRYEIFAAYEVSTAGDTYKLGFPTEQSKQDFIDYCLDQSVIDTGITPTVYDRILTLSTCTGNGHATRWVVQARLKGEVPSDAAAASEEAAQEILPEQVPADPPAMPAEETEETPQEPQQGTAETEEGVPSISGGTPDLPETPQAAEGEGASAQETATSPDVGSDGQLQDSQETAPSREGETTIP